MRKVHNRGGKGLIYDQGLLDAMPEQAVVLDLQGFIVQANQAWCDFGRSNGAPQSAHGPIGLNYLSVCNQGQADQPGAAEGKAARKGIRAVLSGSNEFLFDYNCMGLTQTYEFTLQATRITGLRPGALIRHFDRTRQRQRENLLQQ